MGLEEEDLVTFQDIVAEPQGALLSISLNRPEALNALTARLRQELLQALRDADRNPELRVVVIRGHGRAFSVGQDLKEMTEYYEAHGTRLGKLVQDEYIPIVQALRNLSKPTVAVLEGAAVGGGMALALAADFRVISTRAQMVPGFVNVGLAPDTGTAFLLGRSIGYARALSVCLTGQPIKAAQLVEWGLAASAHDSAESLNEELAQLTDKLSHGPTKAYAVIRRLFDQSAHLPLEAVLGLERDAQEELAQTQDHQSSIAAFLAKQTPEFHGQ